MAVGLLGVTDEHGTSWRNPLDKGRTGLWVRLFDRAGVREAMLARRFFASRERGLRLDASFDGAPMGAPGMPASASTSTRAPTGSASHSGCRSSRPASRCGRWCTSSTSPCPALGRSPSRSQLSRDDGDWVVLRVTDPERPAAGGAEPFGAYSAAGRAVAYASPFFLTTT